MTTDEFLTEFLDILQRDEPLTAETQLSDIEEWDSLSVMATMTWFTTKLGIQNPYKTYASVKTVQDIINLSQGKIA